LQSAQHRQQSQLLTIQVDHAEREIVRKEQANQANLAETAAKIRKIESEILLNREKAETEETKNRLSIYTTQLQAVSSAIDNTIKEIGQENAERLLRQPATTTTIPPNIPS